MYFLGIGGIGMSALARYFKHLGMTVYGYDAVSTPFTRQLEAEGMYIHYVDDVAFIPENVSRVIYTPAVPQSNAEFRYFLSKGMIPEKRAAVVGELSRGLFTIAIAGTHGKTSITAMVSQLLYTAGYPMVAFIGGIAKNFGSNLVADEHPQYMIVEADEFDRSLLTLHPDVAVITSMDADHLDVYGDLESLRRTFFRFVRLLPERGLLVHHKSLSGIEKTGNNRWTYGLTPDAELSAGNIHLEGDRYCFDVLHHGKKLISLKMHVPGKHFAENALAAVGIGLYLKISPTIIKKALENFTGVVRRFDYRLHSAKNIFIDDYAHHPEELRATIQAVRQLYPHRELTVVFQPHLFSRTRDFASDFARALDKADRSILLDIYPAREKEVPGVTSHLIADKMTIEKKYVMSKTELLAFLKKEKPALLLTLGAGDIGLMAEEIEKILKGS